MNVDVAQIVKLILYFVEETSVNTSSAGETTAAALGAKGSSLQYDDGSTCSANSMRRSCVSRSEDTGSTITGGSLFELWTCDRRRRRILDIFDSEAFSKREPQDQQREQVERMESGDVLHHYVPVHWLHVNSNDCAAEPV